MQVKEKSLHMTHDLQRTTDESMLQHLQQIKSATLSLVTERVYQNLNLKAISQIKPQPNKQET